MSVGLKDPENPIVSDWLFSSNVNSIIKYRFPSQKYFLPTTTSHEIGWPWSSPATSKTNAQESSVANSKSYPEGLNKVPLASTLEIFRKQARGQGDVLKYVIII